MKCLKCGREFEPRTSWQKYCSAKCRSCSTTQRYYYRHREELKAKRQENLERDRARQRRYYYEHWEEIRQKQKIYQMTGEYRRGRLTT